MARPTKPKDLKPKAEGELAALPAPAAGGGAPAFDIKYIVLVVVAIVGCVLGSAGSSYVMGTMFIMPEIAKMGSHAPAADGDHDGASGAGNTIGMNLELDEFTVNLKPDPQIGGNQYLRAKMALNVKVPKEENCYLQEHHAQAIPTHVQGGKIVGAAAPVDRTTIASGGAPAALTCEQIFKNNMSKYVPTIRDVINASLMKRTASSLASLEGQEALKDDIKEQLSQLMAPSYEISRVNFEDFIIQR